MAAGFDLLVVGLALTLIAVAINLLAGARSAERTVGPLVFPTVALYFLIATRRWGTTIGKALFELEVVAIDTGTRPRWARAIRRTLVLLALPVIGSVLAMVESWTGNRGFGEIGEILILASVPILAGLLLHASLRTPGKRAPWDRSAGTMVRYRGRQR